MNKRKIYILFILSLLILGCSTTKNLPKGEVLYTGIKDINITSQDNDTIDSQAKSQVMDALEVAPNNALLGSSKYRIPFPFGLWIYNNFGDKKNGISKWIYKQFAAKPVLISKVNPAIRIKAAETIMEDNGYFGGMVTYKEIVDPNNPKKAKISYDVYFPIPYRYSSIEFIKSNSPADSLINDIASQSLLKKGDIFNVNTLEDERTRITSYLRNNGFYYFSPDFISYTADSSYNNKTMALRVTPRQGLPKSLLKPWKIGKIDYSLNNSFGRPPTDTIFYKNIGIFYRHKLNMRKAILYRALAFSEDKLFSQKDIDATQANISRLNTFKYVDISFTPVDTIHKIDSLNVLIDATFDIPMDAELEFQVTSKSNKQKGPGASFGVTKRNVFGGGEIFSSKLDASYEWMTGEGAKNSKGNDLINSYEFGANFTLTVPKLLAPRFFHRDHSFPASTSFKIDANLLNRSGFFRLLTAGGAMQYDFNSSVTRHHSFVPFDLSYSYLLNTTTAFDSVINENRGLRLGFENQFIPAIGYTYTYDNSPIKPNQSTMWYQGSIKEAGNLMYGLTSIFQKKEAENDKTIFGRKFSQFVKLTSDFRYYFKLGEKSTLAARIFGGVVIPYLNSEVVPYSEQFFIGGANSIRAFSVRSIGPGSYHPSKDALYSYLDQTGNLKLETNIEYRFPILGNLYGATFIDAGNIWLIKEDVDRPKAKFEWKSFGKDIALGTGAGLRYDITYIVIRFDIGVPIHAPYETGKESYYNINSFFNSLCYHLAIGYPF
ncbi:MAG: BamA/TamA family outer membrane protein [Bacteroidales bacterium]|nr:BamA/TamA family outer membrane protein [Bacteroidales bacterium]